LRKRLITIKKKPEKVTLEELPKHAMRLSLHGIKLLMVIILLYIIAGTIILLVTQGFSFLQNIITLSIGGFFAFFMGYFGWIFAESIMKSFNEKMKK